MNISKEVKDFLSSHAVQVILAVLGILLVAFLIFDAGMAVGARRVFEMQRHELDRGAPPPPGFGIFGISLPHGFMPDGHGTVGTITQISLPNITIAARDGTNQVTLVETDTDIRSGTQTLEPKDLQVGQSVIVVGEPEEGTTTDQLEARLIRIISQ